MLTFHAEGNFDCVISWHVTTQKTEHLVRHPWGKVPVLERDGFSLFETVAPLRRQGLLRPVATATGARQRARMAQICAVLDN